MCANCLTDFKYNFFFCTEHVSKCGQLRDMKSVTLCNVINYLEYMSTDCHRQAAQCHNNQNQNHQTAWSRIQNLLPVMCTQCHSIFCSLAFTNHHPPPSFKVSYLFLLIEKCLTYICTWKHSIFLTWKYFILVCLQFRESCFLSKINVIKNGHKHDITHLYLVTIKHSALDLK